MSAPRPQHIETRADIDAGTNWLIAAEPRFAKAIEATGPLPLRRRAGGFSQLLAAIVSQQLSVASADAIWARLQEAGLTEAAVLLGADENRLRACGLSRQKITYARALAGSGIDYGALAALPDEEVIARLVAVKGIGRWSAEIYAMFSLGRADVFAAGDLALQEAVRLLFALQSRPREAALRKTALAWSPWRAIAARALWAYYRHVKQREGIR